MENSILYIVVPCYNEEEVLPETSKRLLVKLSSLIELGKISEKSRILFVNDGSKDKTWEIISTLHNDDKHFLGVNLSRNRGHQNALLAGLMTAKNYADAVVSMDADLQDDIEAIDEMIEKFQSGTEIVYGVRKARKKDTFFKRFTAEGFYKVMDKMGAEVVFNHADYRLMSKKALEGLSKFSEVNLFLRGMVPMIGYKSDIVFYERAERFAGKSKYPLKKMLAFAYEGITSLTTTPIKMIRNTGLVFSFLGFIATILTAVFFFAKNLNGVFLSISFTAFIGGIILFSLGIVGDYVGKTYLETKKRPRYILSEVLLDEDRDEQV